MQGSRGRAFRANVRLDVDGSAVVVSGEIDAHTAAHLEDAIEHAAEAASTVDLDLSQVSFMGSSGLRALLAARQRGDRRIVLVDPSPVVVSLLQATELDSLFPVRRRPTGG